jgi:hypothetical protein
VEDPPPACQPDTFNTCQPGPPAERLSIFLDLCKSTHARPTQTRSYIKKGFKSTVHKVLYYYNKPIKEHQGRYCWNDASDSFWKNASVTSGKKMSCSAAQI